MFYYDDLWLLWIFAFSLPGYFGLVSQPAGSARNRQDTMRYRALCHPPSHSLQVLSDIAILRAIKLWTSLSDDQTDFLLLSIVDGYFIFWRLLSAAFHLLYSNSNIFPCGYAIAHSLTFSPFLIICIGTYLARFLLPRAYLLTHYPFIHGSTKQSNKRLKVFETFILPVFAWFGSRGLRTIFRSSISAV